MHSDPMFLARDELKALTHRTRSDAQVRALRAMGIEHRVRPDGTVAVLRSHVEEVLSGKPRAVAAKERKGEPNWDAI